MWFEDRATAGAHRSAARVAVPLFVLVAGTVWAERASATVWLEGRGGAGVASGHYEFEKEYESGETGETLVAHDEGGPFGIPVTLGVVAGYGFDEKMAVGVSARVELAPYIEEINPRHSALNAHLLAAVGPAFAFRPKRRLELRVAAEWAFADFTGSRTDIGADDNVYEFESLSGPGFGFSFGYPCAPGWGFSTATNLVFLTSEHQSLTLLTFTLLASWSSW